MNRRETFAEFIERLDTLDLVMLQHALRTYPEDKEKLYQVLDELGRRWAEKRDE